MCEANLYGIASGAHDAFRPGDDDGSTAPPISNSSSTDVYEKITPSTLIQNSLLAVTTASANDRQDEIRDSSIRGYIYIADVDEAKRKIKLLSPQPGQMPNNVMVLGSFPEDVPSLVS